MQILLVSVLCILLLNGIECIWWSLGLQTKLFSSAPSTAVYAPSSSSRLDIQDVNEFCSSLSGLTPGQTKLCQLYSDHISAVAKGARIGTMECQWQFRHQQWNCSNISNETVYGPSITNIGK